MTDAIPPFTPEEAARLTKIWDRMYVLYLEQANGERHGAEYTPRGPPLARTVELQVART